MNPVIQGIEYSAAWWRLCGRVAETNLRILQAMTDASARQVQSAGVPIVAFGIYAAKSSTPRKVDAPASSAAALERARETARTLDLRPRSEMPQMQGARVLPAPAPDSLPKSQALLAGGA